MGFFSSFKKRLETDDSFAPEMIKASGMTTGIGTLLLLVGMAAGPVGLGVAAGAGVAILLGSGIMVYSAYKAFEKIHNDPASPAPVVVVPPAPAAAAPVAPVKKITLNFGGKRATAQQASAPAAPAAGNNPQP